MTTRPQASDLLRRAATPRWLGLAAIAVAIMVGCVGLGRWQWDRTQNILKAERASQGVAVPVGELMGVGEPLPDESIGRPVTATGSYLPAEQVLVLQRVWHDKAGIWVLTPMQLADGSIVGVLRGWLPSESSPGVQPPSGRVTVTGIMHPNERFYPDAVTDAGTAVSISSDRLSAVWGSSTRSGYVMLTSSSPSEQPAPLPADPTVQTADVPFPLQNFFYAFQWWIFAGFVLVVYGRWLWLDTTEPPVEQP